MPAIGNAERRTMPRKALALALIIILMIIAWLYSFAESRSD
jgi:hypothetical protein